LASREDSLAGTGARIPRAVPFFQPRSLERSVSAATPLDVTCPTCRAAPGVACPEEHPARLLAAKALRRMPAPRAEDSPEARTTKAARRRQRERARDPRMNNDW